MEPWAEQLVSSLVLEVVEDKKLVVQELAWLEELLIVSQLEHWNSSEPRYWYRGCIAFFDNT